MLNYHILTTILVLIGAFCMLAAIVTSVRTGPNVPSAYVSQWRLLIILMTFFLVGYLVFLLIEIMGVPLPINLIAGSVFFGGACFVLLILRLTKSIIKNLREREHLLEEARDLLEERVMERTRDLEQAMTELAHETREHRQAATKNATLNIELLQILNSAADGIRIINQDFVVQRVNSTFVEMMELPPDEPIGQTCFEMISNADCRTSDCPHHAILGGALHYEKERQVLTRTNKTITCLVNAAPFHDSDGKLIGIIESFRDISERKAMEERLREMSITDEMTGLLNRRGFLKMAAQQLKIAQRLESSIFLIYADIDDFKQINDTLGHDVGDEAIIETARLLCDTFRQADIIGIGRLGGDEFSVLMFSSNETTCCNHPALQRLESKLRERNESTDKPYQLSISTGLAQYDHNHPQSIDELLLLGDTAMYECKRQRKAKQQD